MPLGRLEKVDLRTAWLGEASHFTPWLAQEENISLLSETIGIDLEVEAQEMNVGPFRADILCKDTTTGKWVLIENQLERTDHSHLGQLITYASGLDAVTIVWIASRFTDEHRAALDWLNNHTSESLEFFGLEVELWKIGNSLSAPKFNVVSSPNDWTAQVTKGAREVESLSRTPIQELQLKFWTGFREFSQSKNSLYKATKAHPQHWMDMAIGRSGFRLTAIASSLPTIEGSVGPNELRANLEIYSLDSHKYFEALEPHRPQLEAEIGANEVLYWTRTEGVQCCRIFFATPAELSDENRWPEYFSWLHDHLNKLHKMFSLRIKTLSIPGVETSGVEIVE